MLTFIKRHSMYLRFLPLFFLVLCGLAACGKFGPPLPPEVLAPTAVSELDATTSAQGIKLSWRAPDRDHRGKELNEMGGYMIYRRVTSISSEAAESKKNDTNFELLTTIEDKHIAELKRIREEALVAGKPARRLKVDDALKLFEFADSSVKGGETYLYRIVPFNQGRVEGRVNKIVKVIFNGDTSDISLINNDEEIELVDIF